MSCETDVTKACNQLKWKPNGFEEFSCQKEIATRHSYIHFHHYGVQEGTKNVELLGDG